MHARGERDRPVGLGPREVAVPPCVGHEPTLLLVVDLAHEHKASGAARHDHRGNLAGRPRRAPVGAVPPVVDDRRAQHEVLQGGVAAAHRDPEDPRQEEDAQHRAQQAQTGEVLTNA